MKVFNQNKGIFTLIFFVKPQFTNFWEKPALKSSSGSQRIREIFCELQGSLKLLDSQFQVRIWWNIGLKYPFWHWYRLIKLNWEALHHQSLKVTTWNSALAITWCPSEKLKNILISIFFFDDALLTTRTRLVHNTLAIIRIKTHRGSSCTSQNKQNTNRLQLHQ